MEDWLQRTEMLIGKNNIENLKTKTVAIFGLGGVGSYAAEAIVRSGIGHVILFDNDTISLTNLNRQLIATKDTIGKLKVAVAKERFLAINPNLIIETYSDFIAPENVSVLNSSWDYIIDAIDSIPSKMALIEEAKKKNISIISCMGTGNKLNPSLFKITDISKTSVCPLAKIIRKECKQRNIKNVKVLYSEEQPIQQENHSIPASISFVPSVAGLLLAGEVIRTFLNN